jgi:uncharacterized protein YdaU (DUF1376 family)
MNYYERYCGDYAKKTARLTLIQHGAYTLLLDEYYSTEEPLPESFDELYRVCRAMSKPEQEAVRFVAERFFPIGPDGLRHNDRADEMIEKARPKMEAARVNGRKGGRPRKNPVGYVTENPEETQWVSSGFPEQNPEETQSESSPTPTPLEPLVNKTVVGTPVRPAELSAAMRRNSIEANPGDPRIVAAAEAGITVATIEAACAEAKASDPGGRIRPGYVVAIAQRWTAEAKNPKALRSRAPPRSYHDERRETIEGLTGRNRKHEHDDNIIDAPGPVARLAG